MNTKEDVLFSLPRSVISFLCHTLVLCPLLSLSITQLRLPLNENGQVQRNKQHTIQSQTMLQMATTTTKTASKKRIASSDTAKQCLFELVERPSVLSADTKMHTQTEWMALWMRSGANETRKKNRSAHIKRHNHIQKSGRSSSNSRWSDIMNCNNNVCENLCWLKFCLCQCLRMIQSNELVFFVFEIAKTFKIRDKFPRNK